LREKVAKRTSARSGSNFDIKAHLAEIGSVQNSAAGIMPFWTCSACKTMKMVLKNWAKIVAFLEDLLDINVKGKDPSLGLLPLLKDSEEMKLHTPDWDSDSWGTFECYTSELDKF